jgi:signal transduction histidine kinase
LREVSTNAGCDLSLSTDSPILGQWDRLRIEQVLMNIISNAIKYGAGQPIQVSTTKAADSAVVTIVDNGPGIPENELSRIFERFERASSTRHYGGMGLGLYVARQIAEAHGGTLTASNRPNRGACFTVRLPL